MSQELESLVSTLEFTDKLREQYINEVARWLLYRDPNIGSWYSDSQKALLLEIWELRNELKQLKQKS